MVRSTAAVRLLAGDKEPVRLASTANLSLSGLLTVDGVVTVAGDRVLVKNQTDATANGIYTASEGAWQRAPDAAANRTLIAGMKVAVQEGTAHAGDVWKLATDRPDIGVDSITWTFYLSDDTVADINQAAVEFSDIADDILATAWAATNSVDYASRAVAALVVTPVGMTFLRTAGLLAAGDGGGHLYKKGVSLTTGGFQDAGGVFWDLAVDGGAQIVDSKATAQTMRFHASTNVVVTGGSAAAGDGGGLTYKRGTVAGPGAFADAGGVYWEAATGGGSGAGSPMPGGRITLTSGTPVMSSSVTAATTLYYAPYVGNTVPIITSSVMQVYPFTASANDAVGLSIVLGANWAANSIYDVFVALDGSTVRLATGPDWSAGAVAGSNTIGASSRGTGAGSTELQIASGLLTNKNSITLRYANASTFVAAANAATFLGTIRTGSAGQVSFTLGSNAATGGIANLYVWNAYNQARVVTTVGDTTASWTYSSATIRASNNSANNRVNFLCGLAQGAIHASLSQTVRNLNVLGSFVRVGIALNSTTVMDIAGQVTNPAAATNDSTATPTKGYPGRLGANYISAVEGSDGTNLGTFFGNPGFQDFALTVGLDM